MRQILKDAYKSDEAFYQLAEIDAVDEKKDPEEFTDEFIIKEVRFCLEKYKGGIGFEHEEELAGERGREAQKAAKKNVRALEAFLKKYG